MTIPKVEKMIKALESFQSNSSDIINKIMLSLESLIVDLNTDDQLFEKGINSDGEEIISYAPYSEVTIEIKQLKGQPTDRVTLRDEGDFHSSFALEHVTGGVEIVAKDAKTDELLFQYGDEVLGLTEENLEYVLVNYVLPELISSLKKVLGL